MVFGVQAFQALLAQTCLALLHTAQTFLLHVQANLKCEPVIKNLKVTVTKV